MRLRVIPVSDLGCDATSPGSDLSEELLAVHRSTDRVVDRAHLLHPDVKAGEGDAIQRGADFDRFRPEEIRHESLVIQIVGGEQLIRHIEVAAIPDRLDCPTHERFVI